MTPTLNQLSLWLPARLRRGASALWRETDGGWYGPRGACGCCESCNIFSDDFNRADDTDLGADWSEVSGSWSIVSNTLVTSSTGAICNYTGTLPTPNAEISVNLTGNTNDVLRVLFCYVDSSNYWYVQLPIGNSVAMTIVSVVSGSPTTVTTVTLNAPTGSTYLLKVCFDESRGVAAKLYDSTGSTLIGQTFYPSSSLPSGSIGLGTGSTAAAVVFDNYSAQKATGDCADCQQCNICSVASDTPSAWDATLPTLSNNSCTNCSQWSGQTYRLTWCPPYESFGIHCMWSSDVIGTCSSVSYRLRLYGSTNLGHGFMLFLVSVDTCTLHAFGSTRQWRNTSTSQDCESMITLSAHSPFTGACTSTSSATIVPVFA